MTYVSECGWIQEGEEGYDEVDAPEFEIPILSTQETTYLAFGVDFEARKAYLATSSSNVDSPTAEGAAQTTQWTPWRAVSRSIVQTLKFKRYVNFSKVKEKMLLKSDPYEFEYVLNEGASLTRE